MTVEMQTLEELKRQNAEAEADEQSELAQEDAQTETEEAAEVEAEETDPEAQTESEESEETEVEAWMVGDDEASQSSEEQTVPLKALVRTRNKLKGERDELREELEQLKKQINAQPQVVDEPQKAASAPKLEDFDYDEAKYAQAMADFYTSQVEAKLNNHQQAAQQQAAIKQKQEAVNKSVDDHYSRAEKMIKDNGISPDVFKDSELKARMLVDKVFPDQGNETLDVLIDHLGEGSEKFVYALGRNSTMQAEFESLLRTDPYKAVAYASRKIAEFNVPSRRKSTARKPAKQISGSESTGSSSNELRKYKEAHKNKDVNKAIGIKRAAKQAGIDTSKW